MQDTHPSATTQKFKVKKRIYDNDNNYWRSGPIIFHLSMLENFQQANITNYSSHCAHGNFLGIRFTGGEHLFHFLDISAH
jgi:hypothetical protein